jgi:hypothetical protein
VKLRQEMRRLSPVVFIAQVLARRILRNFSLCGQLLICYRTTAFTEIHISGNRVYQKDLRWEWFS